MSWRLPSELLPQSAQDDAPNTGDTANRMFKSRRRISVNPNTSPGCRSRVPPSLVSYLLFVSGSDGTGDESFGSSEEGADHIGDLTQGLTESLQIGEAQLGGTFGVPEPASLGLLGFGAVRLLARRRRA